jgi:hypothetical protein
MSDMKSVTPDLSLVDIGHIYRSTFLEECANIEGWADRLLRQVDVRRQAISRKRPLLSQKISELQRCAAEDLTKAGGERLLKSPARIQKLLSRLKPFTDLRSVLSHSTQSVRLTPSGTHVYVYTPACGLGAKALCVTLSEQVQVSLLAQLRSLAKELNDQRMR